MERIFSLSCPLLQNITREEAGVLLSVLHANVITYGKGQTIAEAGVPTARAAVLLEGLAVTSRNNYLGNEVVVAHIRPGAAFLLSEALAGQPPLFSYIAVEKTAVLFFDVQDARIPSVAGGIAFQQNIIRLLSELSMNMSRKVSILTLKTLEEKAIAMLELFSRPAGSVAVTLPFTRQGMAEYLAADRSALSYALMKLKRKGVIDYNKNHFTLLYKNGPARK